MEAGLELSILSYECGFLRKKFNTIKFWRMILNVVESMNHDGIPC